MPTVLPSMGLTLPTRGAGGAGAWGDTLDADLALLDAHDHTVGRGARIVTAALNINADLPFSSLWAPTQLHRVQFSNIAVAGITGAMVKSLFVSDGTGGLANNELYWRSNAGASVQITNAGALNVGAFVGGIGGDYGSVSAQLNFTDSTKTYDMKEGTADSHGWARVQCGGLRIIEFGTTESFFVAQTAPAALAASYTTTWPTALPGSTVLQQIDSTGQIIWSNTVPNAVTFSAVVTVSSGGAAITGNSSVTGNLSVTGTFSYPRTYEYTAGFGIAGTGATGPSSGASGGGMSIAVGTGTNGAAALPFPTIQGTTITAWQVRIIKNTNAANTISAKLWKANSGTGTQVGSTQSNSANAPGLITLSQSSLTETVPASNSYYIEIVGGSASGDLVIDYAVTIA